MSDGQENALAWFDMFSFEFGCCKRSVPPSPPTPVPFPLWWTLHGGVLFNLKHYLALRLRFNTSVVSAFALVSVDPILHDDDVVDIVY